MALLGKYILHQHGPAHRAGTNASTVIIFSYFALTFEILLNQTTMDYSSCYTCNRYSTFMRFASDCINTSVFTHHVPTEWVCCQLFCDIVCAQIKGIYL